MKLEDFTRGKKRGCKRYRMVMSGKFSRSYQANNPMRIAAGRTLWGDDVDRMGRGLVGKNYSLWTINFLSAEFKNFLFRLVQGKLYLNNQLVHFGEVDRWCTFCSIREKKRMRLEGVGDGWAEYIRRMTCLPVESTDHMFWECDLVRAPVDKLVQEITGNRYGITSKNNYFGGWMTDKALETKVILITIHFIKFCIYENRMHRRMPTYAHLRHEFLGWWNEMKTCLKWAGVFERIPVLLGGIFING